MSANNKNKVWAILGEEAIPLALVVAKTEFRAKKKYEAKSGHSRHCVYAEEVDISGGYHPFLSRG